MQYISFEQDGMIGTITINRPRELNALNEQVLSELNQLLDQVAGLKLRCLILTGAGEKAFAAGADIGEMKDMTKAEAKTYCLNGNAVLRRLEIQPVPVIAAVHGYTLGGGCELMMAADIRIASERSVFGQPEAGLGITAGFGGTQRLARLIGAGKAKELLYTAKKINAAEALEIGLVNAVYPADTLMEKVYEMAEQIAANAPIAVRATKMAVNEGLQTDMDQAIVIEAEYFSGCFETGDQVAAMTAFTEKTTIKAFQDA